MLQVLMILVDEVPDLTKDIILCPIEPVFSGRFDIEHCVAVKFRRIELIDLILSTMSATIDSSKDDVSSSSGWEIRTSYNSTLSTEDVESFGDLVKYCVALVKKVL